MPPTLITTSAELNDAIVNSVGGDTFTLVPGDYDLPTKSGLVKSQEVVFSGQDPNNRAVLRNGTDLQDCANLTFDGIDFQNDNRGANSRALNVQGGENFKHLNGRISGGEDAGRFIAVAGLNIESVVVDNPVIDYLKISGGCRDVVINRVTGSPISTPIAPDHHPDFIHLHGGAENVDIWGTVFIPGHTYQGGSLQNDWVANIFASNGHFKNVKVEQCICYVKNAHGATFETNSNTSGQEVSLLNNTLLHIPPFGAIKSTRAITPGDALSVSERNIETITEGFAGLSGTNHRVHPETVSSPFHYSKYFVNATRGFGATITDLAPVPAGPADFVNQLGAYIRLQELLNPGNGEQDPMFTYIIETAPDVGIGTLEIIDPATGAMRFTPVTDVVGNTSFQYRKTSAVFGNHAIGTVQVNVVPPTVIAPDGSLQVDANTPLDFNVETL